MRRACCNHPDQKLPDREVFILVLEQRDLYWTSDIFLLFCFFFCPPPLLFSAPPSQVSPPLRASGSIGGGPWSLLGGLQHHSRPEVFSSQPLWRYLWPVGAVCPRSRPPRHQHYRLSFRGASYRAFTPQHLPIKCQTYMFMFCRSIHRDILQGTTEPVFRDCSADQNHVDQLFEHYFMLSCPFNTGLLAGLWHPQWPQIRETPCNMFFLILILEHTCKITCCSSPLYHSVFADLLISMNVTWCLFSAQWSCFRCSCVQVHVGLSGTWTLIVLLADVHFKSNYQSYWLR